MNTESSPMVPGTRWGQLVEGFTAGNEPQMILCAVCELQNLDIAPPRKIIIDDGKSLCVLHFQAKHEVLP